MIVVGVVKVEALDSAGTSGVVLHAAGVAGTGKGRRGGGGK